MNDQDTAADNAVAACPPDTAQAPAAVGAPPLGHRQAWQDLYPRPGTGCPMCRQPLETAVAVVTYRLGRHPRVGRLERARRWLCRAVGADPIPEDERDAEVWRRVVFGLCGCQWYDVLNPWIDLLCVVGCPDGTVFVQQARSRYEREPRVRLERASGRLRLPEPDLERVKAEAVQALAGGGTSALA